MRIPRIAVIFLVASATAMLLAACGGSPTPASLSDIPIFAGAEQAPAAGNTITEAMVSSIEQSIAKQNLTSDVKLYRLPDDTTWDDVKTYYTGAVGGDWKASDELTQEAGVINIIGWQRGSGNSEQVLIVGEAEDPVSGDHFLLLGLFSE